MGQPMIAFTLGMFVDHLGDEFAIRGAPDGATLTLVEAEASDRSADPATCSAFSLIFRGQPERVLAQQTVTLGHPELGDRSIFIVPVGEDAQGISYQAVFN